MNHRQRFFSWSLLIGAACAAPVPAAHAGLPYGPDTCRQGFVWREAFPGDHVCVTPETRQQALHDNYHAAARRQPGGGAYGPNTCRQGFVWREAFPADRVCVTPDTRARTAADNRQAAARRAVAAPVPVPAPATAPTVTVRREDERCYQYANYAMRQYKLAMNRPGCAVQTNGRWQPNYENHYQWCLRVPDQALGSEQSARTDHLVRCGAQVRFG